MATTQSPTTTSHPFPSGISSFRAARIHWDIIDLALNRNSWHPATTASLEHPVGDDKVAWVVPRCFWRERQMRRAESRDQLNLLSFGARLNPPNSLVADSVASERSSSADAPRSIDRERD